MTKFSLKWIPVVWAFSVVTLQAATLQLTDTQRSDLELSLYNGNLAVVSDSRRLKLPEGGSRLSFLAISPFIDPVTAVLYPLPGWLSLMQQGYRPALSAASLRAVSLGSMVSLVERNPLSGEETHSAARVVSLEGEGIFEIDGQYLIGPGGREIIYANAPAGTSTPVFSVDVISEQAAETVLSLNYQTRGISWQLDYVARLNEARDRVQLRAMANLSNQSGIDYPEVRINLVAGNINRISPQMPASVGMRMAVASDVAAAPPPSEAESVGDLYRYRLPGRVNLDSGSLRQVQLFEARDVPVEVRYRLSAEASVYYSPGRPLSQQVLNVDSYVDFKNLSENQLGMPLPAGTVRLYIESEQPSGLIFIGEDRIAHTPDQATVSLNTGQAFNLRASRRQLSYRQLPVEQPYRQIREVEVETRLSNAGSEAVDIEVAEVFPGEWALLEGPAPQRSLARSAVWLVRVPAGGEASLKIKVRVKN